MSKLAIIFIILIVCIAIALIVYVIELDKKKQLKQLKEWLLLAVIQAEKELGDGTGQIKLRFVYDLFLTRFKWLSKFISFEYFSILVDETLEVMRNMLENNNSIKNYVSNIKK